MRFEKGKESSTKGLFHIHRKYRDLNYKEEEGEGDFNFYFESFYPNPLAYYKKVKVK